ncbi:ADP-ribosylation factor-like protein 6-interacting protein 4 [Astyanax mexicanus]|uniref:ADP-ribosylation factor-like protein 6-interacting protein 4 n=1 Tax=Astyanax mexicanus TaxID=7994 RepID=A0A8T2LGZ3_ASTMX|nr:ADP-ribosylation factor-like protein 6-interacting protein 4 [Astyanax mexicanus]
MLTRSKIQGLGLYIVGERVWDNINEGLGEEVTHFLRCRLPGSKEEAVVPVQTETQIRMLRAAEPDHQARGEQLAESVHRCSNMDNSSCDSGSVKDLTCPADTQQVRKRDEAPTATLQLEKLREQRKTLVEKRDQLRAELSKLADSAVAASSVRPQSQSQCAPPNQSESDEAKRQRTISSSSSTSTSTSTSSASSSEKKKSKKRRKYNKKDKKRSFTKSKFSRV